MSVIDVDASIVSQVIESARAEAGNDRIDDYLILALIAISLFVVINTVLSILYLRVFCVMQDVFGNDTMCHSLVTTCYYHMLFFEIAFLYLLVVELQCFFLWYR